MKYLVICILALVVFSCKSPEARQPISHSSGSFIKKSAERNKKLYEAEQKRINTVLKKYSEQQILASDNGFKYFYNIKVEGDSLMPKFGDVVSFDYNIKDLNGTIIYSEEELSTQKYIMDKQELFSGLREGLKLMKPGETVTFFFPSQIAYGYYGDENKIGTNIPLICEVTLNTINQKENN